MKSRTGKKWFYRGKEARGRGEPRRLDDGRVSPLARQCFHAGWDAEDARRSPQPTVQERENFRAGISSIIDDIATPKAPRIGEICRLWLEGHPFNRMNVTVISIHNDRITCSGPVGTVTCTAANLAPLKTPFTPYAP